MVSKLFSILLLSITLESRFTFSADEPELGASKDHCGISSIPLSEFFSTFRHQQHDSLEIQLSVMLLSASCGDRLYNLSADVSAECWRTSKAHSLMLEKLAFELEATKLMNTVKASVIKDLREFTELKEHPMELLCRGLEKQYAEEPKLKSIYEKAKKDAANFQNASNRPPYFCELQQSEGFMSKLKDKWNDPELIKMVVYFSFSDLSKYFGQSKTPTYFARTLQAVAKKENYTDLVQIILEKAINDILPEIIAKDGVKIYLATAKPKARVDSIWWATSMVKSCYSYIAKDPILKKEVDDMAAVVNEDAPKDELDFSKL